MTDLITIYFEGLWVLMTAEPDYGWKLLGYIAIGHWELYMTLDWTGVDVKKQLHLKLSFEIT